MSDDSVTDALKIAQKNLNRTKAQAELAAGDISFARQTAVEVKSPVIREALLRRAKKRHAGATARVSKAQTEFREINMAKLNEEEVREALATVGEALNFAIEAYATIFKGEIEPSQNTVFTRMVTSNAVQELGGDRPYKVPKQVTPQEIRAFNQDRSSAPDLQEVWDKVGKDLATMREQGLLTAKNNGSSEKVIYEFKETQKGTQLFRASLSLS